MLRCKEAISQAIHIGERIDLQMLCREDNEKCDALQKDWKEDGQI